MVTPVLYRHKDAPRKTVKSNTLDRTWDNVVEIDGDSYKLQGTNRNAFFEKFQMKVVDGRNHLPGGKEAWMFWTMSKMLIRVRATA